MIFTASPVVNTQFVAALCAVALGLSYCVAIGSRKMMRVLSLVIYIAIFAFFSAIVWGKIYVREKASITLDQIAADPSRAVAVLTDALSVDPSSSLAHFKRGVAYLKQKDPQRAYSDLKTATDLTKHYTEVHTLDLAKAARQIGNAKEAITLFSSVLAKEPKNFDALNGRGLAETLLLEPTKAISDFQSALAVAPDDDSRFIADMNLSVPLSMLKRYDETLKYLKDANSIRPNNPHVLIALASTYGELGIYSGKGSQKALDYANLALAIDPSSLPARMARIAALMVLGARQQAITEITQLITEHPKNGDLLRVRSRLYASEGKQDLAENDFRAAQSLPSTPIAPFQMERY